MDGMEQPCGRLKIKFNSVKINRNKDSLVIDHQPNGREKNVTVIAVVVVKGDKEIGQEEVGRKTQYL